MSRLASIAAPAPPGLVRARVPAVLSMVGAAAIALALGAVVALQPLAGAMLVVASAVMALVFLRPEFAAYLLIGLTPLIVGMDRGRVLPLLRPNEALLVLVGAPLLVRGLVRWPSGQLFRPGLTPLTTAMVAMALCNSIVLLAWNAARGVPATTDDFLYALVLWKYLAVYAVVRASIRTRQQIRRCVVLCITSGCLVGAIAILQSLRALGVPELLGTLYVPTAGDEAVLLNRRGSSTIGLPAAMADLMMLNASMVVGLIFLPRSSEASRRSVPVVAGLVAAALLLVTATLASGQFSAAIGLAVAIAALAAVSGRGRLLLLVPIAGVIAAVLLRPVIENRLAGFQTASGLPESWVGRLHNLHSYFWPRLFADGNWVLGVRPDAHVPGPSALGIKWVWIESGYTWLLWGGGLPLLVSYLAFLWLGIGRSWQIARHEGAPMRVVATAVFVGLVTQAVLMIFDPHLTYRGAADILFALIALLTVGAHLSRSAPPASATSAVRARAP